MTAKVTAGLVECSDSLMLDLSLVTGGLTAYREGYMDFITSQHLYQALQYRYGNCEIPKRSMTVIQKNNKKKCSYTQATLTAILLGEPGLAPLILPYHTSCLTPSHHVLLRHKKEQR